ncbi:MAG: cation:proton antiporter [Flavobacteriaceae bacterium]|nr:cation:proton antiporter [Flavobacteriaceae bacterium]
MRNALAILIFQDIIVVLSMMLLYPSWQVNQPISLLAFSRVCMQVCCRYFKYTEAYGLLYQNYCMRVAKTNSKELFLLVTFTLCFAVAFLTSEAGLSLALGAFIAGLIISITTMFSVIKSIIRPFRELFSSFFLFRWACYSLSFF